MSIEQEKQDNELATSNFSYEQAVNTVLAVTCGFSGTDFFKSLVRHLTTGLGVRCAYVGELIDPSALIVQTLAIYNNGRFEHNLEFRLFNTPCEILPQDGVAYFPAGVQEKFPNDPILKEMNANSYYGISLQDAFGDKIGILIVLDDQPFRLSNPIEVLFRMLADRSALEIERIRAEKSLMLSEDKYKSFVELMPQGVVEIDTGGYITFLNTHALELSGYSEEDVRRGLNVLDTIPTDQQALMHANIDLALKGEKREPSEYTLIRKDGRLVPVRIFSAPVFEDGVSVGIRAIILDITIEQRLKDLENKE